MKTKPQQSTRIAAAKSNLLTVKIERGFSLIELMVASAIALIILVAVSNVFINSSSNERANNAASEFTTNGRYAIETLRRDILLAGFKGLTSFPRTTPTTALSNFLVTGDCGTRFATNTTLNPLGGNEYELGGLFGANDTNPYSGTCVPSASYSTGDILVSRHAAENSTPTLVANTLYMRSTYGQWELYKGNTALAGFTKEPQLNYKYQTSVYYISPNTSGTDGVPALYKAALGAGPAMTSSLVASNIQDMQFQYGRTDKNTATTRFYNANQISATATPSEWESISSVRIWILVRGTNVEPGYTNGNAYTLGDKTIAAANDGYRREVFSTVVKVRNF